MKYPYVIVPVVLLASLLSAQDRYRIETVAGGPAPVGVAATSTFLTSPQGLAFDSTGNLFLADLNSGRIKMITPGGTSLTVVAGNGGNGYTGDGGSPISATFAAVRYVAFDPARNLFITDTGNCVIRRIDATTHLISTYAGNGTCGYSGDGLSATAAQLNGPRNITFDSLGNLYIADPNNGRVRMVDAATKKMSTYAGTGTTGYNGDNQAATTANLNIPFSVAFDHVNHDLYIGDNGQHRIRRVDHVTGKIYTYAGGAGAGFTEGGAAIGARIGSIRQIAFDSANNLYYADSNNCRIMRVNSSDSKLVTVAGNGMAWYSGDGGSPTGAAFTSTEGLAIDAGDNIYVSDFNSNVIRKISLTPTPIIVTFAGSLGPENVDGKLGFVNRPSGVAVNAALNSVVVMDSSNSRLRMIDASGKINTVAGVGFAARWSGGSQPALSTSLYWPQMAIASPLGEVYFSEQGFCTVRSYNPIANTVNTEVGNGTCGYGGDGGSPGSALLSYPTAIAIEPGGNGGYIADTGNNMVRKVTGDTITLFAGTNETDNYGYNGDGKLATGARLASPNGLTVDSTGSVIISDTGNNRIRKVDHATGFISTIAGNGTSGFTDGSASLAEFSGQAGIQFGINGELFIADCGNNRVRRLKDNYVTTVAGTGAAGYSGDGGPATLAALTCPNDVAVDATGRVYVADMMNNAIRRLVPQYYLTTGVSPAGAGTVTPGDYFDAGTNASVTAKANPGFQFVSFSGAVTSTSSTISVPMTARRSLAANFIALNPSIQGVVTDRANGSGVNERDYGLRLSNVGMGPGYGCQVTSASMATTAGAGSSSLIALPPAYGDLTIGAQVTQTLRATVPATVLRLNLTVSGSCRNSLGVAVPFTAIAAVFR